MTDQDTNNAKQSLLNEYRSLERNASETGLLENAAPYGVELKQLPEKLHRLRQQGYVFGKRLQTEIAHTLDREWSAVEQPIRDFARRRGTDMSWRMQNLRSAFQNLNDAEGVAATMYMDRLSAELPAIHRDYDDCVTEIKRMLGTMPQTIDAYQRRLRLIELTLKHGAGAGFALQNEAIHTAVEAEWKKGNNDKENPDGIFYITDKRVIMERKEKQGGFIGMGGKLVQEVVWFLPLEQVASVNSEKKGLMGGIDLIHLQFKPGAAFESTTIEVKGHIDAHEFAEHLRSLLNGGIEADRIV